MTIPLEYQTATAGFDRFLAAARDRAGLSTRNQTYTMVEGVLRTFRRRLTVEQAIAFAGLLPPVLRAIFVADWDLRELVVAFGDRAELTREVQALRPDHNFSPDSSIEDVAAALRPEIEAAAFDRLIATLPPGAAEYWRVTDGEGLGPTIKSARQEKMC